MFRFLVLDGGISERFDMYGSGSVATSQLLCYFQLISLHDDAVCAKLMPILQFLSSPGSLPNRLDRFCYLYVYSSISRQRCDIFVLDVTYC